MKELNTQKKSALRKHYLMLRENLHEDYVHKASTSIAEKLFTIPEFINSDVIHCYVSIPGNNEVISDIIIHKCFGMDKIVIIPKVAGDGLLTHHQIESLQKLEPNEWGVREPVEEKEWPLSEIDLVIVPMVAGDGYCNRLGYGKGYYDRFLALTNCPKIGLLFDCQLHSNTLPVDTFDVRLDRIITEKKVIS